MLHQTQVPRAGAAWPAFMERFPTPEVMADAGPGAVIEAWGRLGYPRRARRLWDAAVIIARDGWPDDLTVLPGVGRYTAAAVRCQADDRDVPAVEVNIRRVVERVEGRRLTEREAERAMVEIGRPLRGRDRLLALMDVGAIGVQAARPALRRVPARGPVRDARRARARNAARARRRSRGPSASDGARCSRACAAARRRSR